MKQFRATTIVAVRRGSDDVCIAGDGQVTMGETAIRKAGAKKVQKIYKDLLVISFSESVHGDSPGCDIFGVAQYFGRDPRGILPENAVIRTVTDGESPFLLTFTGFSGKVDLRCSKA